MATPICNEHVSLLSLYNVYARPMSHLKRGAIELCVGLDRVLWHHEGDERKALILAGKVVNGQVNLRQQACSTEEAELHTSYI